MLMALRLYGWTSETWGLVYEPALDLLHEACVRKDLEGLEKAFVLLDGHQHACRAARPGDDELLPHLFDTGEETGEVSLRFGEGEGRHDQILD